MKRFGIFGGNSNPPKASLTVYVNGQALTDRVVKRLKYFFKYIEMDVIIRTNLDDRFTFDVLIVDPYFILRDTGPFEKMLKKTKEKHLVVAVSFANDSLNKVAGLGIENYKTLKLDLYEQMTPDECTVLGKEMLALIMQPIN